MENMSVLEIIKLLMPVILLQYGLALFCVYLILKNGVRNLNKIIWILIVVFVNLLGSICFLLFGRKR